MARSRGGMLGVALFCVMLGALAAPRAVAEEPKAKPQTMLFLGDSITAAGGYVRNIQAELSKPDAAQPLQIINHGKSSETVSDLSEEYHPGRRPCLFARLDDELAKNKPDWVVACYGINDGIYHPFNEKRFEAYQAGVKKLIEKVHASGARLILLTPTPYARSGPAFPEGSDAAAQEKLLAEANAAAEAEAVKDPRKFGYKSPFAYYDLAVLDRYAKWLLTLDGQGVSVIDLRTPMLPHVKDAYGRDPIHPNGTGHKIMSDAFLKQWPAIKEKAEKK